jgi:hypothetical protein
MTEASGSHGGEYQAFWNIVLRSFILVDRRFKHAYYLHHRRPDAGCSKDL